jgi:RNA polymerase sigma-70 factor, ECF subfamily
MGFMMDPSMATLTGALVSFENESTRLRNGDPQAIAALMTRYQHRLYRYLLRMVSESGTAEDLFQQTWLRIIERSRNYDDRRSFEGWLFAVAHNLAIDYLRRRKPESLDEPLQSGETQSSQLQSIDQGALDQILSRERADIVSEAISGLHVSFREVITLRFEEEMKLEEIAAVLSLPVGTVKTRLHRGLKALRNSLARKLGAGA